ncbi:hypothetical protein SRCM101294_01868 [Bacillus amyloliquefaciens]|uniref:hypothetical protein n=1 Tax=Bacillus amyloliquefaciens TaxID=1390 RepID=UPI00080C70CF|nr:hypothetical protein [Bacillus amyloliquefaciens]OCB95625.1 hypothetical protein SRCM101294_01868 [Bacillus amyloliquefaciens]
MDDVKHKKTGQIYYAYQVQNMSEDKQLMLKGLIICKECGKDAWFRKKSVDGKEPCFSAKHDNGCGLKKSNASGIKKDNRTSQNKKETDTKNIGILFKDYFNDNSLSEEYDEKFGYIEKKGDSRNIYDKDPAQIKQKQWTLKRILDSAINNNLGDIGISLKIDNRVIPIENIVFSWDLLSQQQIGALGLYWGYLYSSDNDIWINSDKSYPYNNFSIKLTDKVKKKYWLSVGKAIGNWENGVPAIVFGELKCFSSGKYYVEVYDLTRFYINRREYKYNKK